MALRRHDVPHGLELSVGPIGVVVEVELHVHAPGVLKGLEQHAAKLWQAGLSVATAAAFVDAGMALAGQHSKLCRLVGIAGRAIHPSVANLLCYHR